MTPDQQTAVDLQKTGLTQAQIADRMGKTPEAVKSLLRRARKWMDAPDGQQKAIEVSGLDIDRAKHGWRVIQHEDGSRDSVFWKSDSADEQNDLLERIADAFQSVPAYRPNPIAPVNDALMTVYPLYDMHAGMMAWGRETRDQDYDLDLMKSDLINSIETISANSPASDHAVVIFGGDTIHVNDQKNETPGSGHKMDADGRFEKIVDMTIEAVTNAIELLSERHAKVSVYVIRGNHDEESHIILKAALKQRYRLSDAIEFPKIDAWDKSEIYWLRHGKSLIIMHHGDKCKPERLAMIAADKCPWWSDTTHRVILTGHLHHFKVQDFPGVTHYTLRAFCPPDAYGAMFGGKRGVQAMTFSNVKGLVNQAHDPIER